MRKSRKLTNVIVFCLFLWPLLFSGCIGQSGEGVIDRGSINSVEVLVNGKSTSNADTGDEVTWAIRWEVWGDPKSSIYNVSFQVIDPDQPGHVWAEAWDDKQGDGTRAQKSISMTMPDQNVRYSIVMSDETGTKLDETDPEVIINNLHRSSEGRVVSGDITSVTVYVKGAEATTAAPGDQVWFEIKWRIWGEPETSVYTVTFKVVDSNQPDHVWAEDWDDKQGDGSRAQKSISMTMPDQDLQFYIAMVDEAGHQIDATDSQIITVLV